MVEMAVWRNGNPPKNKFKQPLKYDVINRQLYFL